MPLTQGKRLDSNITNNNDHNYLHKKFKKMASTSLDCTTTNAQVDEMRHNEMDNPQVSCYNTSISNRSIAAAHPEIEKIKTPPNHLNLIAEHIKHNVQINFNEDSIRDVNNVERVAGKTSYTQEFSNKTDNTENEYKDVHNGGTGGRYICPYCKLSCAKPSVLQKHIRAHTNERPYPCVPCGFAFKTKSNLYKHRRSRTHALRLQGADVSATTYDEEMSGGSESDTSLPPPSISETGSDTSLTRPELSRPSEFSSPELFNDRITPPNTTVSNDGNKMKSIYKPKFRAAFYQNIDECDKNKKSLSSNADFLTEHISKIISDNEAIVDDIEMPLQKKYGKIKQIAESKQYLNENNESKFDASPLNLTKSNNGDNEISFRKRSHSETFSSSDNSKHPLNPEGSIIKDLLLKTKGNGLVPLTGELIDGLGPLFVCPVCQIIYRSADNLEIHRLYYCKGMSNNVPATQVSPRDSKSSRPENIFVRSNSINVRLPESPPLSFNKINPSPALIMRNKPDNLIITKPESNEIIAPLPSPGPLLGNTRLVDTRGPDFSKKSEYIKVKPISSPKRKADSRSDTYSPRSIENESPRSLDLYPQAKIRCMETNPIQLRSLDDLPHHIKHNSTSLQMFGGEVKIVDHSGGTTTLRIEPSKNQLSPILLQPNLSPSKLAELEASSVVVRSGLHSGGTIVHNPPTPKDGIISTQSQTPRSARGGINGILNPNMPNIQGNTHFQFPPLSAITAYNPLTLPPLSPNTSMNGATTILHGGKLIPHVPGIPGPNTPGIFISTSSGQQKNSFNDTNRVSIDSPHEMFIKDIKSENNLKRDKSPNTKNVSDSVQNVFNTETPKYISGIPTIKVKNVDETNAVSKVLLASVKPTTPVQESLVKRNNEGFVRLPVFKEGVNIPVIKLNAVEKNNRATNLKTNAITIRQTTETRNFNFENLITKVEIFNNQVQSSLEVHKNSDVRETTKSPVQNDIIRSETSYFQKNCNAKTSTDDRKPKFLRPSTLPLKPGTFTPKKHHGITPNANTMPLVSPETPRPAKAYGQLYLNGNAYTYLGLKCSTKVSYCTINRPQPTYVPNQHFLSMYSNWQLLSDLTPDPLGLSASTAMSLYDSRHRPQNNTVAVMKQDLILTHSSKWNTVTKEEKKTFTSSDIKKSEDNKLPLSDSNCQSKKELTGGFESNEEYTYVRGRGRGRYVCSECGIRCKKPSMLKKHIRTHTDVRPYTCVHCAFSFKTKGNLTKHMKSKAHYKKCCELGITPIEGTDVEVGEMAQCSGETDDDTESDGDEGNEGETESSDTEICKSRLPEHEAAHCLLSLGGNTVTTSNTPGLITSARPSTYPYAPTNVNKALLSPIRISRSRNSSIDSRTDTENEPMDLSKNEIKSAYNIPEIPTARESSVLASLASNTAKLPQPQIQWSNGEPMLHTYLTERALLDTKIKQSQVTSSLSKVRKMDIEKSMQNPQENTNNTVTTVKASIQISVPPISNQIITTNISAFKAVTSDKVILQSASKVDTLIDASDPNLVNVNRVTTNSKAENAKHVVSEYLKHTRIHILNDNTLNSSDIPEGSNAPATENHEKIDELKSQEMELPKMSSLDHDPVARKVVIGAGGVAFKVTKGKEYDGSSTFTPGKLMEDGRRVCDFCNKTFTKPSQLRLHLNIHYMERPFRCSACAVSFRTRGHLQKHERSGSHHNKVSMTSTFGAATSLNPRPFRCSDCNIAFRIHGHLAKHLRSKMHVMRLECLFKLPFGTFTEIERAGLSLTDIDTTDCASSLASLQSLARKLHEKDPTKLEYRDPSSAAANPSVGQDSSDEEDNASGNTYESEKDSEMKVDDQKDGPSNESSVNTSATDN